MQLPSHPFRVRYLLVPIARYNPLCCVELFFFFCCCCFSPSPLRFPNRVRYFISTTTYLPTLLPTPRPLVMVALAKAEASSRTLHKLVTRRKGVKRIQCPKAGSKRLVQGLFFFRFRVLRSISPFFPGACVCLCIFFFVVVAALSLSLSLLLVSSCNVSDPCSRCKRMAFWDATVHFPASSETAHVQALPPLTGRPVL